MFYSQGPVVIIEGFCPTSY